MPITEILERNCKLYGDDVCLVEVNPEIKDNRRVTWKEYELIESNSPSYYRREITWNVFNEKANRFANLLLSRGIKKGELILHTLFLEGISCGGIHLCSLSAGTKFVRQLFQHLRCQFFLFHNFTP